MHDRDAGDESVCSMLPQEMRTASIARPLEINETEKVLRAAIREVVVRVPPDVRMLTSCSGN